MTNRHRIDRLTAVFASGVASTAVLAILAAVQDELLVAGVAGGLLCVQIVVRIWPTDSLERDGRGG